MRIENGCKNLNCFYHYFCVRLIILCAMSVQDMWNHVLHNETLNLLPSLIVLILLSICTNSLSRFTFTFLTCLTSVKFSRHFFIVSIFSLSSYFAVLSIIHCLIFFLKTSSLLTFIIRESIAQHLLSRRKWHSTSTVCF